MRRLLPLVPALALLALPFGATPASACAAPDEGEPQCCYSPIVSVMVADRTVVVQDPTRVPDCP